MDMIKHNKKYECTKFKYIKSVYIVVFDIETVLENAKVAILDRL